MGSEKRQNGHAMNGHGPGHVQLAQDDHSDTDPDEMCGIGSFRPKWLQKFADIRVFVASLSIIIFMKNAANYYTVGVVRTIEKRFGLNSTQTGFIMSAADIVQICLIVFITYYGDKAHKPRILGIMAIALIISGFICGSIHFMFPPEAFESSVLGSVSTVHVDIYKNITSVSNLTRPDAQMCIKASNSTTYSQECTDAKKKSLDGDSGAYAMFIVSQIFLGLGGSGANALGLSYIHENAPKGKAAQYFGICSSMFAWGPICGFGVAALTTRWPENLKFSAYPPRDPRFIGCWWLGYYIFSAVMAVCFVPMILLPRRLPGTAVKKVVDVKKKRQEDKKLLKWFWSQTKDFPRAVGLLFNNASFLCLLVFYVCGCYVMAGVMQNQPRYLENFFYLPAFKASLLTGLQGALAAAFGIIIGGVMMQKLQPTLHRIALWIIIISLAVTALSIGTFLFVCPQRDLGGTINPETKMLNINMGCNANCSCNEEQFKPVCGADGKTYYSPCHAGCKSYDALNNTYTMCSCLGGGSAESGYCSITCNTLIPFVTLLFIGAFIGGISRVPVIQIQMGIARPDQKAFLLGVTSFVINLLGMIPAPILFGNLVDSACIFWRRKPCGRLGACLFYNLTRFRFMIMGVPLLFKPPMLISQLAIFFILLRKYKRSKQNIIDCDGNEKAESIIIGTKEEQSRLTDENSNYDKQTEQKL